MRDVAALPVTVGELVDGWRLDNGVELRKIRVPLGVIAVIYEARPNVTVDAAALCLKSGNAVILRGGSAALHTNRILAEVVQGAVIETGLPREAVSYLGPDRRELAELLKRRRHVDLVIRAAERTSRSTCSRTARSRSSTPPAATATFTWTPLRTSTRPCRSS